MVPHSVHILIALFPAFGHSIPAISLAKRILSTPSLSEFRDVKGDAERLVTLLISKKFLPLLKEKGIIPDTESYSEIYRGKYGRMYIELLEDGMEPVHTLLLGDHLKYFESSSKHVEAIGTFLESKKNSAIPPSCIILDMFAGMFEPFPFDHLPFYFFFSSPVVIPIQQVEPEPKTREVVDKNIIPTNRLLKKGFSLMYPRLAKSEGIIWNTSSCIEADYLSASLKTYAPNTPVYRVGPLNFPKLESNKAARKMQNENGGHTEHHHDQLSNGNSRATPSDLDSWIAHYLDEKPTQSVLYVSFGTVVFHSSSQIMELLNGLNATGRHVLWSLSKKQQAFLPLAEMTSPMKGVLVYNKVAVVEWATQGTVLSHPSCAAFLTHCGWNSAFESLICGVGTIHWPVFADQPAVSGLLVKLGTGIAFDFDSESSRTDGATNLDLIPAENITKKIEKFFGESEGGENRYAKAAKKISSKLKIAWTSEGEAYRALGKLLSIMESV
ncbi:uncharacterized protein VTP21DRAFT_5372 [Calcarisporiella thermophila]|uniref:uncharacterized protein n=1 Tax=Calcarisporiella thermophila TaxID=911321 RepID=UPI003742B448